ncbi:MAG: hypothetical protein KAR42_12695 [candidate division Zixibacteria bacterium]|nr:hypothetical protein [candidate division Zixibacteria bacterium]
MQKIDREQVKILIKNNIRLDWRGSTNPLSSYQSKKKKFPGIVVIFIMNAVLSVILSMFFFKTADLFSGLVFTAFATMMVISMQIMLEFGNTLITSEDYLIIAPHPVSSKTFFMSKIIHTILYVTALSVSISAVPAVAAGLKYKSIGVVFLVFIHFWVCNIFAAALIMNIYTWVLKVIDRQRLERWLGYMHMVFIFSAYIGMNIIPRMFKHVLVDINVEDLIWTKLLPSYWFGTWIKMAIDGWQLYHLLLGLLGIVLFLILGKIAVSYLSLSYAESLTKTGWNKKKKRHNKSSSIISRIWRKYSNEEDRALLMLIRANFKHDIQFRIGVLSMVPLVIFYLVFSLISEGSNVRDPFAPVEGTQGMTNIMFGIACIIAPYTLIGSLQASKQWKAAWVFFAAPLNRVNLIRAMERISNLLVTIPMAIFLSIILSFLYGSVLHAVLHTITLIVIALCALTLINVFSIKLPFAMDNTSNNWAGSVFKTMFVGMLVFGIPLGVIGTKGYGGYLGWMLYIIIFLFVRWLLGLGQIRRIKKALAKWEFTG